jgi:hypothetical protein
MYGDDEVWFDTETGQLYKPNKPDAELTALGREYRQAPESGSARIAGEDTLDGEPVVWITIHSESLPDVADGKDHEWRGKLPSRDGTAFRQGREPISRGQAPTVLGRTPLWLGDSYNGLPLAQVYRETTSVGRQTRVRLTGAKAAAAIKCSPATGSAGGDCFRQLGLSSLEVRPESLRASARGVCP